MNQTLVVFSVPHQLQGEGFDGHIPDPWYGDLVTAIIREGEIDFVFEEARGQKPSIAKDCSASLGSDRYLNVDLPANEGETSSRDTSNAPTQLPVRCEGMPVLLQRDREELWIKRILSKRFERGLLVCGYCHNLSIAFRLVSAGIAVDWAYSYVPMPGQGGR